jgi:hypothetical protein
MDIKSEKYTVNGRGFYFRWNVRARIGFQKATGMIITPDTDPDDIDLDEDQAYMMAYHGTIAGMRKEGEPFDMSFDEYLDFIDMDIQPLVDLFERMTPKGTDTPEPGKKKRQRNP